jgi:hypothetical protein
LFRFDGLDATVRALHLYDTDGDFQPGRHPLGVSMATSCCSMKLIEIVIFRHGSIDEFLCDVSVKASSKVLVLGLLQPSACELLKVGLPTIFFKLL